MNHMRLVNNSMVLLSEKFSSMRIHKMMLGRQLDHKKPILFDALVLLRRFHFEED